MIKTKILQICAIDETVKSLLLPLIDRLTLEGFEVISCCSKGKNADELLSKGYKIINLDIARSISPISNLKTIFNLYKLIKKEKFEVVHVHTPVAALLGRIAAKLAGVKIIIYTAHGFYFHDRMSKLKYFLFFWIEKLAGRLLTDFIMTQSEEDRQTAISCGIIKKGKILTISNGVDVKVKFNPVNIDIEILGQKELELGINKDDIVLTFIGRQVREKGIIELLEAFSQIENSKVKLMLVGDTFTGERDTDTYEYITSIVKNNNRIIATGRRYDIEFLLSMSNIFILPSYREGMPRSIIEAMAIGKAVIATNIRGCREEVVDGETGFLVEIQNSNELKEKILELVNNPILMKVMGEKARKRAIELFDEDMVLDKEVKVIKGLIYNGQFTMDN